MPDEVYLAPRCGLWSPMLSINALTPEKREELSIQRQHHHDVHLQFCKVIYIRQVRDGRHAHLEQPQAALRWKTKAPSRLPGHRVTLDQCRYGACCLDKDGTWRLVKKSTSLQTSKRAVAQAMTLRCDRGHQHCQLEGQMPGFGRARASYLEDYQPTLAAVLASCLAAPEVPTAWDTAFAVNEEKAIHGQIVQLMTDHKAEAVRAGQRLHRNLGHPTTIALVEMLESRGASEAVLNVARSYQCHACLKYPKPNQVAPASTKVVCKFNQSIQADTMWIKNGNSKHPILSVVDKGTRFMMAHLLVGARSQDFIQALERHWISHFGVPARLVTDEGRGWLHCDFQEWTDSQSIQHVVAAGEAHEQFALVERRHAVLRKALEVYLMDFGLEGANAIRQALSYVVPQLNNNPSTSPSQWVLGQSPTFPGELLGTNLTPVHLDTPFEDELSRRAVAKMAIVQADADQKLRRALLRKYAGTNIALSPGQTCFYWRDARAADLVKIRWKGPATILMREDDDDGRPRVYWIGHKTQPLRCAPHHVRPEIGRSTSTLIGDLQVAKDMLQALKSRGVTRYSDLTIKNKRNIDDVDSGDEMMDDGDSDDDHPPSPKRRLVDPAVYEREALGISEFEQIEREMDFTPAPPSVPYSPSVASSIANDAEQSHPIGLRDQHQIPPGLEEQAADGDPPGLAIDPQAPGLGLLEPEQLGDGDIPQADMQGDETHGQVPFSMEPSREPSPKTPQPPRLPQAAQLDPVTAAYYDPATAEEFRAHRRRLERQETIILDPSEDECFRPPLPLHQVPCRLFPGLLTLMALGLTLNPPKKKTMDFRSQSLAILAMDFRPLTPMIWSTLLFPLDGMWKMATSFSTTPPKTTGK